MLFRIFNKFDLLLLLFKLKNMNYRIIVGIISCILLFIILCLSFCCCFGGYHNWFSQEVHLEEKDIGEP